MCVCFVKILNQNTSKQPLHHSWCFYDQYMEGKIDTYRTLLRSGVMDGGGAHL